MKRILKPILVKHGESTIKIFINVYLIEHIAENKNSVTIKMSNGSQWIVSEPIDQLIERLQADIR